MYREFIDFFRDKNCNFFKEPKKSKSNYWLNSIIFENKQQKGKFLEETYF
jgi:perosamine synthetase